MCIGQESPDGDSIPFTFSGTMCLFLPVAKKAIGNSGIDWDCTHLIKWGAGALSCFCLVTQYLCKRENK